MMNKLLAMMVCLALLVWENVLRADDSNTLQAKYSACAHCHGIEGNNKELPGPNLAGQNRAYLVNQVNLFRGNKRIHPVLSSTDLEIHSSEIDALVGYYANLKPENPVTRLDEDGELMYSPCSACHGANGEGIAPFPRLLGQKPAYLEQQLINFRGGARQNATMQAMAINLSDEEIKWLAVYLGSQKKPDGVITSEIDSIDPNDADY